ncbi:MAG: hypothetical protein DWG77_05405, partial [Chloroflexi bacterium]|nr:hypothetical protein [Chloroflexota bacterium]
MRALPRLATRRMRRNWRLLSSVATGTLVASAILATTAIYADAIRDLGLEHAVAARDARELDIRLSQSNVPVNAATHQAALTQQSEAVLTASRGNASPGSSQGTSTTFYPTSAGDQPALADSVRPRGNFVFRTDLLDHIEIVDGAPPTARQQRRDEPIETLIGAATASEQGISVGDVLDMHPFWDAQAAPVRVVVTGIAREIDPTARYWGAVEERLDARERSWPTLRLWIPSESFFGALHQSVPTVAADYLSIFHVTLDELNSRNALDIADGLRTLSVTINTGSQRTTYASDLEGLLRSYDEKLFFTQIPLLVLMLQIGAIVAYYLVMVSTMLIERQAAEITTMRSRGATTSQLLAIYGVEGTILAALSAAVGPILAGGVISLLGPTPAFSDLSGGGPLDVHVGTTAYALAMVGALIAFTSLMIPAWRATRNSVVEFKRGVARPSQTPAFMRYYLDVVFVLVVAALFWRLSRQDDLFSETIFGETQVDPILLATPAVFMVTVGVVFLRLFPLVLHGIEWIVGWTRSVAILIGMRSLVRQPSHYARLILLLMFATGVGIFGATFSSTLDQSYRDRAAYEAGADIRALFSASEVGGGDAAARAVIESIPADRVALAARTEGAVYIDRSTSDRFSILAVDGTTFDDIAFLRDDFSPQPLDDLGETLTASRPEAMQGPLLPAGTQQIGVWAQFPDIRGRMEIQIAMRDATGTVVRRTVASAAPTEAHAEEWRFYAASVTPPIGQRRGGI